MFSMKMNWQKKLDYKFQLCYTYQKFSVLNRKSIAERKKGKFKTFENRCRKCDRGNGFCRGKKG